MLVSTNWLKDFVTLPKNLDPADFANRITMHSVEVEEIKLLADALQNVVVGVVKTAEKHPNADSLQVCMVDAGTEDVHIVCGGSNVVAGMKVALGKIGASVLWHGEGEPVELKKTKIRGEISEGMICAADEIGLGALFPKTDEKEILDVSHISAKPGTALADALGLNDMIIDIENKTMTHRPDLWGHYGLAREIAAIEKSKLQAYAPAKIKPGKAEKISVSIKEKQLCKRYMAVMLDGIEIAPSPQWMQQRLQAVGVAPINNIVDITIYVMLEIGQPMHAFDATQIAGNSIIVRKAKQGESFTTLNDVEVELSSDMLVIADKNRAVAVAGVKGDKTSGVVDTTTSIIFESANFDATSVRKTAQTLGIRTDSSTRFEKTLDPNMCDLALARAVELTLEICPNAKIVSNIADESSFELDQGPIAVSIEFLQQKIGASIDAKTATDILERLGFVVKVKKDELQVTVPTWRATKDISIAEDIVEEVARMYGYGNVETHLPKFDITPPPENALRDVLAHTQNIMSLENGYNEALTYSFVSPELLSKVEVTPSKHIELDNPVAKDRPFLRRCLLPNLLELTEKNLHRYDDVMLYEVGRVFIAEEDGQTLSAKSKERLPKQDTHVSGVCAQKGNETPFYAASTAVQTLCTRLGAHVKVVASQKKRTLAHPGRCADVMVEGTYVGYISELHPKLAGNMGIDVRVGFFDINLNVVVEARNVQSPYTQLSVFPAVERDIAILVASDVEHADVVKTISNVDPLIVDVELFDVYSGNKLDEGTKSMAYHISYRSKEKTLESSDIDAVHDKVLQALDKKHNAKVRS